MKYRPMTAADLDRAVSLYMDHYSTREGGAWTRPTAYKRLHQVLSREDSCCLVAEEDGELAALAPGYFEQYDDGPAYDRVEIVVAAGRQDQGIGTAMMGEVEARAKAQGALLVQLSAVNDRFHAHFYGRLGYRPATNLVLMTKMLTDADAHGPRRECAVAAL